MAITPVTLLPVFEISNILISWKKDGSMMAITPVTLLPVFEMYQCGDM